MTGNPLAWPEERVEELKRLHADGLTYAAIAEALGVGRNTIAGKVCRLGLSRPREKRLPPKPREARRRHAFGGMSIKAKASRKPLREAKPLPVPPTCEPVRLADIDDNLFVRCRSIVGNPNGPDTLFCGAPSEPGLSWCRWHAMIYMPGMVT